MRDVSGAIPWIALAVSVVSVCFAGAVWWTSREKLRLDLYNRRFDVYSRTLDFYHALLGWEPTELETAKTSLRDSPELGNTQKAFIKASREAQFLFDDASGIQKQLEQVHTDTIWVIGYKRDLPRNSLDPSTRISAFNEFTERMNRINASIPLLEEKMSRYLDFHAL
ncbi:MAG: hypothetical protein WA542_07570 [Candidatus Acidiferrum sp.]